MFGKTTSAAILSLAKASADEPAGRSGRLAAAAFQSTIATETCGTFISSAGAPAETSKARATRKARFNPASLVLPRQRRVENIVRLS